MRVAWLTDPHLNHASAVSWDSLIRSIEASSPDALVSSPDALVGPPDALVGPPDALLLTGDISEGEDVVFQLNRLTAALAGPIYFVLGNHDFYGGSVARTRSRMVEVCGAESRLVYLTDQFPVALSPGVGLVGDDGWGDATIGDYDHSPVRLADFQHIDDFRTEPSEHWQRRLQALGQESADRLRPKLRQACERFRTVVVATHVPPFREACWYEGQTTDDLWAPFFVCGHLGKLLMEFAERYPEHRWLVLCGHTHHGGVAHLRDNLTVVTGGAEYGQPRLTGLIDVDGETCRWSVAE
ncbi:metallophosphoesterase family protein [Roseimaritima sediminicola]|uniref:metallophosphoesterase family protein n=1 Tax=Roseimaritima sediminicola TaxID=2662066 RepID=UPI00129838D7|nr:metallophosphoesterase [Roseimaritima sediminicola]